MEACTLRFRPILMTGLAFVCGVLPMVIATGAGGASQQALGTSVMGGMIAVVILALLMVPVFFVVVQRALAGDREAVEEAAARAAGARRASRRRRPSFAGPDPAIHLLRSLCAGLMDARVKPAHDGIRLAAYFPSGFRIFTSSACTNSLPQITLPVFSGSSSPSMPETVPPASRMMIWPAAMSHGCRLRSQ